MYWAKRFLLCLFLSSAAQAQTPGTFIPNQVLTASELNTALGLKADYATLLTATANSLLSALPPFTTPCNLLGVTAVATACPALTAQAPLGISGGTVLNVNTSAPAGMFIGGAGPAGVITTNSIGVGFLSLLALNSGANGNIAIGPSSLANLATGVNNVAIGVNAGSGLSTSSSSNVLVGSGTMGLAAPGAQSNTAVGVNCLNKATGSTNICMGALALSDLTSGSVNTAIGPSAGRGITTGSNDTIIGGCTGLAAGLANAIGLCDGAGNLRFDWGITTASTMTLAGPVKSTTGFIATAVAPTVAAAQIGYGSTTVAAGAGTCPTGTVGGQTVAGCIVVNIAGASKNVPFF